MYISYVIVQSYTLMLLALLTAFPENSVLFRRNRFFNSVIGVVKNFFNWLRIGFKGKLFALLF